MTEAQKAEPGQPLKRPKRPAAPRNWGGRERKKRGIRSEPSGPRVLPAVHVPLAGEYTPEELAAMTPRTRLDAIHAMQATVEYRIRRGQLVERAEVEAEQRETAELIRLAMFRTLPARLGHLLAGKVRTDHEVREVVLREVRDVVRSWKAGGVPSPEKEGG